MAYKYQVDQCDVADRGALLAYRERREEWLHLLQGDKEHSVSVQITGMLWSDAVFRTMNEARRIATQGAYPSSARNWSISRFVDQGFVATQTLSIRKLMESAAKKPERQVVSLRRVLDEMRRDIHLFTRENYVCHDGLPYDPEPGRTAFYEAAIRRGGVHSEWLATTGPTAWSTSEQVHSEFDALAGVTPEQRSRQDAMLPAIFDAIDREIEASGWKEIAEFGNKFIAHAADEYSRSTLLDDRNGLSLDELQKCHRAICRAVATVFGPILWAGAHGLFPIPQFNHFDNLDAAWLRSDDVEQLRGFWSKHVEQVDVWSNEPLASK